MRCKLCSYWTGFYRTYFYNITKHIHRKYPSGFPQLPHRWLPSWKAHSTFITSPLHLKVKSQLHSLSGGREKVPRRVFPAVIGKCSLQEPRAHQGQEGHQGQGSASGTLRAVLPHLSSPLKAQMHKPRARSYSYSYKAYFKGKLHLGQELQHKRFLSFQKFTFPESHGKQQTRNLF